LGSSRVEDPLHRQMRTELGQVGELECGLGSSLAHSLIALCLDERIAIMCSGGGNSLKRQKTSRFAGPRKIDNAYDAEWLF
jgi:hypothetical protein